MGLAERRDSTVGRDARPLPLLYGITHALKKRNKEKKSESEWPPENDDGVEEDGDVGKSGVAERRRFHDAKTCRRRRKTNYTSEGLNDVVAFWPDMLLAI